MKKIVGLLFLLCLMLCPVNLAEASVAILCYHEVDRANDDFAVSHQQLEQQIVFMKKQGYHFVSLEEYLEYTRGEITLPDKSAMITFDDGYRSFYTKVYPLLKKYQVPGMLAIVSSWTNGEEKPNDVRDTASWEELREMESSGLVTVVSHTHAMHKQQAINPQGSRNGVAGSHLYVNGHYESDEEYRSRVGNDIEEVQHLFQEKLGHKCRAMVWPYGIYTEEAVQLALDSGMEATFLLDGGVNEPGKESGIYARRMIMDREVNNAKLQKLLTVNHDSWDSNNLRMVQVDLDDIFSEDTGKYERNIRALVDNLQGNNIRVIALQAFADPDGDGNVEEVYFKNGEIPVRADIFGDVANRLRQQGFTVLAWLPVLNYQPFIKEDGSNAVQSKGEKGWYHRLSPFDGEGLRRVNRLFRDLAANTQVDGVLLQDDLYLNDDEDVSECARDAWRAEFGNDLLAVPATAEGKAELARWKVAALDKAADDAVAAFKEVRPKAIVMRDIYAGALLYPGAEEWLGQSYEDYLKKYDYTVVMAYPYMDEADDPAEYLRQVARAVQEKGGTDKTIVKIQSFDWEKDRWLDGNEFSGELALLKRAGIKHLGCYPMGFQRW